MASTNPLVTDLATLVDHVPSRYIRPITDRPTKVDFSSSIPLVDLHGLYNPSKCFHIIKQIASACETDGVFQVKNHGVSENLVDNILGIGREFFALPESERLKNYSDDNTKNSKLSTSYHAKTTEKVANWRDVLKLHCYPPLRGYLHEWPLNPPSFREYATAYNTSVRVLALTLFELLSESLGLERDYINKVIGKHFETMAFNYYPPCPQPELTYGIPAHTDPTLINILLQDHVPGLQVLRNDKWVAVNPIPYTFTVILGDQMQVISNDRYKSLLHRAVVNCETERMSIPMSYRPSPDASIAPAKELIDEDHPAMYKEFTYKKYFETFVSNDFATNGFATQSCLDMFKIAT